MPEFSIASPMPVSARELYAWHVRAGAFERLIPPWERIRILRSDGPPRDGGGVVFQVRKGLLRLTWEAVHSNCVEGTSFTDEMVRGPFAAWKHVHRFVPGEGEGQSRLEDSLTYQLPLQPVTGGVVGRKLAGDIARLFAFRHARTRDDLARHAAGGMQPMRIVMTGSTGAIGRDLHHFLTTGGHCVHRLVRRKPAPESTEIFWQPGPGPRGGQIDEAAMEGADAVIHLAGESIVSGRWTAAKKEAIRASRVEGTRLIARTVANLKRKPRCLIIASGIHYYGDRGDQELAEDAGLGSGFLAEVSREWEAADEAARQAGVRVVNLRIGLVLSARTGLAAFIAPWARLGLMSMLGPATQWWSWIAQDDLLGVILHALANEEVRGGVNAVTPRPVRMHEFAATLAGLMGRPLFAKLPEWLLHMLIGERADVLTTSTRAVPEVLRRTGFRFLHPQLPEALAWELGLEGGQEGAQ